MGCAISPILFVLAMEIIIRAAEKAGPGVSLRNEEELLPIRALMDDLTHLNPSTEAVETILSKLEQLMDWGRMKFKAKKSRSLVIRRGKLTNRRGKLTDFHFTLCGEEIPTGTGATSTEPWALVHRGLEGHREGP